MRMLGCKAVDTPIKPNHELGEVLEDSMVDKGSYQRLVGKIIYLTHTRSDITYVVGVVNQFRHNPREAYLKAVYRILHYLKGTPEKGILFKRGETMAVEVYTDANYAGSIMD